MSAQRTDFRITFAVLSVAVFAFGLLQSMIIPALPVIQEHLNTDQATVTWVVTAYLLSASAFTPIIGRIGDTVGKEKMLVVSIGALAVGSLLAAVSTTALWLITARVIQGAGGGILPVAFGIIRDEFPERSIAGAVAFTSSLMGAAGGLGPVMAGPLINGLGFHSLFWVPCVATAVAAVAAWKLIPESPVRTPGRVPVWPTLLFSVWLVAALIAVSQGPAWGWLSRHVLGLLVLAAVVFCAWIITENRVQVPFIDMAMMRRPAVATANLVALLMGFGMFASYAFVPQLYQTPKSYGYGLGATVTESGLLLLPVSVASFLIGIFAAGLARRFGAKTVVVLGGLCGTAGLSLLLLAYEVLPLLVVANALLGLGIGSVLACLANLVVAAVPPEQTGVASGMNANIRNIGGAIGTAAVTSVVTSTANAEGIPSESGYLAGLALMIAMLALMTIAAMLIPGASSRRLDQDLARTPTHVACKRGRMV